MVDSTNSLQGLSGYDFSGIKDQMIQVYSVPKDQMVTAEGKIKVEKDAWREVNTRLSALNTAMEKLRDESTWSAAQATSSNESLLTATAGSNAIQGAYNIKIINTAQAQTVMSSVQTVAASTDATVVTAGSFDMTVGGVTSTVAVGAGDSLAQIAKSINNAKAGVTASVIQVQGGYRLAIAANKTGLANAVTLANVGTGTVLQDIGLADAANALNISQQALDANLTINGIQNITSATNSMTSAIPGVTLNLNGADNGATTISLTIGADNAVPQKAVQEFIDKYNVAVDYIASKMSYNKDTKKAGDLFGDSALQSIQARLRSMVTGTLNNPTGNYGALSLVGIKTTSASDGKLTLDAAKFTAALTTNPQSVANLFGAPAGGVTPSKESGSAQGLANIMNNYLKPLVQFGGSLSQKNDNYDTRIRDYDTRITDFDDKITAYTDMLTLKFASLETLLSQLNQQSTQLASQITSLTASTTS